MKSNTEEGGFFQITIPPNAYEIKSLNNEIKRSIIDEGHFTEANYPFTIKRTFSTLGSIIKISPQGLLISFMSDDSTKHPLGFNPSTLYEEQNLSPNSVDILSFHNIFLECDFAQGSSFKGKGSDIIHNLTMDVDPRFKYNEKITGGVQWYVMGSKDFISTSSFKLKNENGILVSFDDQSITFRLSIKEV